MRARRRPLGWALLAVAAGSPLSAAPVTALPPVRHVFVLVLENQSYESTFGPDSPAPYLARVLPAQGALLRQYYAIGHASLPNYVAMVSGQAPNEQMQLDCPTFAEFVPTALAPDARSRMPMARCISFSFFGTTLTIRLPYT